MMRLVKYKKNDNIVLNVEDVMKKILIFILIFAIPVFFYTQSSFVISGRVTLNGKGVPNVNVLIYSIDNYYSDMKSENQKVEISTKTNSFGGYHFDLKPGKFGIKCDYSPPVAVSEELFVIGPERFELKDKEIANLNFKIVNSWEYIKFNAKILSEIPETVSTVNYKWGKVPIFSEDECKLKAKLFLETLKKEEKKDILNGSSLGIPLKAYDMQGNTVFYQFPITNLDIRIGYIGIHAIGIKPKELNLFNYPSITLQELNEKIVYFKNKNLLMDNKSEIIKKKTALKLDIDPNELMFKKILSLGPDSFSFYMVFNKFPGEEDIIVDMNDYTILSSEKSKEQIQDESEARYTLRYITDMKSDG